MSQEQLRILRNVLNCSKKEGEREREKETERDRERERQRERLARTTGKMLEGGILDRKKTFRLLGKQRSLSIFPFEFEKLMGCPRRCVR